MSFLYKAKKPSPGVVVMVLVKKVNERRTTARVSLLEYSGTLKGRVRNFSTEVGRIHAMKVVNEEGKNQWILDGNISSEERHNADQKYLKAKFVHYLLSAVANEANINVEEILKSMNWPSYEDLDSLRTTFNDSFRRLFSGSGKKEKKLLRRMKNSLKKKVKDIRYFSWRHADASLLQPCFLYQLKEVCWAIGVVRHLEAALKAAGKLDKDSFLSIQDMINKMNRDGLVEYNGSTADLGHICSILQSEGVIDKVHCELSYSLLQDVVEQANLKKFYAKEANLAEDVRPEFVDADAEFHLLRSPIAAYIAMLDSLKAADVTDDTILKPTAEEIDEYEKNGLRHDQYYHVMLLTGFGVDADGTAFWEFQDSHGEDFGDRGFVRIARDYYPIVGFYIIKV